MTEEWNKNAPAGDDDVQMPLGAGMGAGEGTGSDAGYTDGAKTKINNSTLALFAAFAAALVVLYLLGLQNKPRAADAGQQSLEKTANEYIKAHDGTALPVDDITKLRQKINSSLGDATPSKPMIGNPFAQETVAPLPTNSSTPQIDPDPYDRQVAVEFSTYKLQTIMMGQSPMAMISGQVVRPGTQLGSFTVAEIQNNAVVLKYRQGSYKLELNVPNKGK